MRGIILLRIEETEIFQIAPVIPQVARGAEFADFSRYVRMFSHGCVAATKAQDLFPS
jgi:hypothetical protein